MGNVCENVCSNLRSIAQVSMLLASIGCSFTAVMLNELSDVLWQFTTEKIYSDKYNQVDFECGWQELRLKYYYLSGRRVESTFKYEGHLCDQRTNDLYDDQFCDTMESIGLVWVGLIGVSFFCALTNIIMSFKIQKSWKVNVAFCIIGGVAMVCLIAGISHWYANEKCSDIELELESSGSTVVETRLGISMILVFVSATLFGFSVLLALTQCPREAPKLFRKNEFHRIHDDVR